ncbi:monovalent cation/H+ antiporter subunit D family protein [Desulfuromonas thiophila]|uniref:monovalent cation/H+ antiporter subunit D family protein n=1 Tax=Desulfuromonas thiophila TaxID=57664 RepID=UPI0024A826DC|nr:monovalent cation/H+ antiporter subunit D family protein [Desulfuromonas thiophila]
MNLLPLLPVLLPLLCAPLCLLVRGATTVWALTCACTLACFASSLLLAQSLWHGGAALPYALGNWPAPWGIVYHIDALVVLLLLIVTGIAAVTLPYARRSVAQEIQPRDIPLFYALLLICLTGLLGIVSTGDAFNLYVFLELSSLSSYALIGLGQQRRALTAAFQYLVMGTIGATFILIGIGLLYSQTGTLNIADLAGRIAAIPETAYGHRTLITAFAFLTVGISLKLALFPLHLWLPNAYSYAPSVVTVFLAATATKVAVYMLLRVCFSVLGNRFVFEQLTLGKILLLPSLAGIVIASLVAIFQYDIKRMLAYSSVAQIGYMTLGISLNSEAALTASIVHLFNHALMKGALFMVMGAVMYRAGSVYLNDFRGLGQRMPWTMAAFVLGGLSLIGVPGTAGFVSKWLLVQAALQHRWWPVVLVILLGSLLAVIYIWRVVETAYFNPLHEIEHGNAEAPPSLLVPLWLLVGANLYFGFDAAWPLQLAQQAAAVLRGGL